LPPTPNITKPKFSTRFIFVPTENDFSLSWYKQSVKKASLIPIVLCASLIASAQTKVIDSLERIVTLQRHDTTELHALLGLTNEFLRKDLQQSKKFALQVVSLANTPQEVRWLSTAYNYLITVYQQSGEVDSAYYYIQTSEKVVKNNPSNFRMRFNYNQAVSLFYKNIGEYKKALPYMLENLEIWKIEDENKAGQLLNVGNLYINMGEFKKAAESHLQSLRLFELIRSTRGQSYCLHSLGKIFLELKRYNDAKSYLERSLKLKKEIGDKRGLATSSSALADVYTQERQYKLAKEYYENAMKIAHEINMPLEVSRSQHQLGNMYKQMGDLERATENLNQSLKLAQSLKDSSLSKQIESSLIGIDIENQKAKTTESLLLSNLNTSVRTGDRQRQAVEYSRLSEYYALKKEHEKAFNYLKKHIDLTDSVQGSLVLTTLKELEEKYKTEKKEKEIALLKKDQELQSVTLSRQRAIITLGIIAFISVLVIAALLINRFRVIDRTKRLLEIEKVRNNIARDLHDDIGSTLSSINILSQVALAEQNTNPQNYLQRIGDQSKRMMEDMGDMVWSINPRNDSMEQVVVKMREFATEIFERSNTDYTFTEKIEASLKLNADQRKNLFLIYKEAINNAAKYSGAEKIEISLEQRDHKLSMRVRDNGKGFDEQKTKSGNGLRNMRERATEINAQLLLKSTPGEGISVELDLPIG
jgi:two-component system, NarL family, sensor histidine kinase UhpB